MEIFLLLFVSKVNVFFFSMRATPNFSNKTLNFKWCLPESACVKSGVLLFGVFVKSTARRKCKNMNELNRLIRWNHWIINCVWGYINWKEEFAKNGSLFQYWPYKSIDFGLDTKSMYKSHLNSFFATYSMHTHTITNT